MATPQGVVDLYVHAYPDLLPRRCDDLDLAAELKAAGFAAAVHRHHYSPTAERAQLASRATGFDLKGAILLNDAAGGLSPTTVDLALRMGAVWVGLPTLSARYYRSRLGRVAEARRAIIAFGPGDIVVTGPDGEVLPVVDEILDLVAARNAVLNLGYVSLAECEAVQRAASRQRVRKVVLTNPQTVMGLSFEQVADLLEGTDTTVELTAYSMYPGRVGGPDTTPAEAAALVRRLGVERCVLSSDSGTAGAPPTAELVEIACRGLLEAGLSQADLQRLLVDGPARLVG